MNEMCERGLAANDVTAHLKNREVFYEPWWGQITVAEVIKFKYSSGSVPDHCGRCKNSLSEESHTLGSAVHSLPTIGNAFLLGNHLSLLVIAEVLSTQPIAWQDNFASLLLGLLLLRHYVPGKQSQGYLFSTVPEHL